MGGMGLIFTPVLVTHLLGHPGLSGFMTSTSWTHGTSKQSCWQLLPASGFPTHPVTCPPTPTPPPPYNVPSVILQQLKKNLKNQQCLLDGRFSYKPI